MYRCTVNISLDMYHHIRLNTACVPKIWIMTATLSSYIVWARVNLSCTHLVDDGNVWTYVTDVLHKNEAACELAAVVRWHLTTHAADAIVHTSTCITGSQP